MLFIVCSAKRVNIPVFEYSDRLCVQDIDPKVREYTQNAMAVLVGRVRRNLAPYLKNVMGCWVLSRNDTYPTVSSAAQKSFNAAFPPDKQESAMVFCKQAVLEVSGSACSELLLLFLQSISRA